MSETPSSAITTVLGAMPSLPRDRVGGGTVSRMATVAGDADLPIGGEPDNDLQVHDDDAPLGLLARPSGLVEVLLPPDAPFHASDGVEDWAGTAEDALRLARPGAGGLDMVFDGVDTGVHIDADHPVFAAGSDVEVAAAGFGDPLVDLGTLSGDMDGFMPVALDAPLHVDAAVDPTARVDLVAPDLCAPEYSWLATVNGGGLHVGEAFSWSDAQGGYVFDHYV
ncbi:MAG: hypothetical protein KIT36_11780 [Alphaproteobacteria bacterium]|nr:hypothetical protein [Alphaproteobacteria bacterium]